jgi:FKBP-type peptidyl-prolyl cis-trans isomerase 2
MTTIHQHDYNHAMTGDPGCFDVEVLKMSIDTVDVTLAVCDNQSPTSRIGGRYVRAWQHVSRPYS